MSEAEVIARLYREIKELEAERDALVFTYNQADKECERLRGLVSRAADALEKWCVPMRHAESKLIDELRKAAE